MERVLECPTCGEEIKIDFSKINLYKFEIRCPKCGTFLMLHNPEYKEKKDDK